MFQKYLFILSACIILTACGADNSTNGGGGGGSADPSLNEYDLNYTPTERWPEMGSYSYDFDFGINGVNCRTKKSFSSQAAYCMGLQDQNLNDNCALSARKSSYSANCGHDFQEINIKSYYMRSGFDSRLQKSCSTGRPNSNLFKTVKKYCQFLADEKIHEQCFWDARKQEFDDNKCAGAFSSEPAPVVVDPPTPAPGPGGPSPEPGPSPAPVDPLDQIPVVKELRAHGIKVMIDWQAINQSERYKLPSEPSLDEKMSMMWQELEVNKQSILDPKFKFDEVIITIFTTVHDISPATRHFYLDYETKQGSLHEYFPLYEQSAIYKKELGIEFDSIHSGSYSDVESYLPLKNYLFIVKKHYAELKNSGGMFSTIKFESYSHYFTSSKSLYLDRKQPEAELDKYIINFKPLFPFYQWLSQNNVVVDFGMSAEIEKNLSVYTSAIQKIYSKKSDLDKLVQAQMIQEIYIATSGNEQNYYSSLKKLWITVTPQDDKSAVTAIETMGSFASSSLYLGIPLKVTSSSIGQGFRNAAGILAALQKQIAPKKSKISTIEIGFTSGYWKNLQTLTIGTSSSVDDTVKVINGI